MGELGGFSFGEERLYASEGGTRWGFGGRMAMAVPVGGDARGQTGLIASTTAFREMFCGLAAWSHHVIEHLHAAAAWPP